MNMAVPFSTINNRPYFNFYDIIFPISPLYFCWFSYFWAPAPFTDHSFNESVLMTIHVVI